MLERRSFVSRVTRKASHAATWAIVWLHGPWLRRWRAANAAGSRLFAHRLQASTAPVPRAIFDSLRADHQRYVTTVSNPTMAASWEFVALLVRLLATRAFASVVDFGSGFTSYAIRYWCQQAGAVLDLASVDDSAEWLQKTRAYLIASGTRADHLYLGHDALAAESRRPADLLVYDYVSLDRRARLLPQICRFVHPASIILFDDYNPRPPTAHYHNALDLWCWRNSIQLVDLRAQTLDGIGRYAALGYNARAAGFQELLRRL